MSGSSRGLSRPRRGVLVALLLAALFLFAVPYLRAVGGRGNQVGEKAPQFVSTDLSDQTVSLSSYRGRPVILNFWASWCVPCRSEFPVLQQLLARHPQLAVLGVVYQDVDPPARTFLRAQGATWPGVRDPSAQIAKAYGIHTGIPVSVLIDAGGRVRAYQYGPLTDEASADAFVAKAGVKG